MMRFVSITKDWILCLTCNAHCKQGFQSVPLAIELDSRKGKHRKKSYFFRVLEICFFMLYCMRVFFYF